MKPTEFIYFLSVYTLLLLSGCSEELAELNKGDLPLQIRVSASPVELDASNPASEALKFSWTPGSNQGTNAAIDYTFQLGKQGNDFAGALSLELGREVYELTYANEELNDLLTSYFGTPPGSEAALECRVIATFSPASLQPEISLPLPVSVRTHKPVTKTLYLLGSATPNGWDAANATEMKPVANVPKGFTWTGPLVAGEFKFIVTPGEFLPSYNKGAADTELVLRETGEAPDNTFVITESSTYTVTVNLIAGAISIVKGEGPEYGELWFVGNPTGWNFEPMTVDALDPYVFHYNAELPDGGEFKIGTATENWDAVFFRPATDRQAEGTGLDVDKWAGDPDYKWNITGGVYKIKLDTREMKIDIAPFMPSAGVYLVGDATPSGWDIGNATPMDASSGSYTFTWSGPLNEGELKFSLDKQADWNGAWFLAGEAGKAPTGSEEQMVYSYPGAGADYKWKITEAGTYSIELNQLTETVIFRKQ